MIKKKFLKNDFFKLGYNIKMKTMPLRKFFHILTIAVIPLVLSQLSNSSAKEDSKTDLESDVAKSTPLGVRQQSIKRMVAELENQFSDLARLLQEENPDQASKLIDAFKASKEMLLEKRMDDITKLLDLSKLDSANEEQKKEHLPPIVSGEVWWCQGYSEPGSGSDLASLSTKAVEDGDNYVVNGQKIWTSYADKADKIFCLVRTGPQEPKHDGISFLLIDMDQPGVTTRPITLISGKSPFCETFFDDAKAPTKDLVGGLNKGWTVAKRLLEHERTMISAMGLSGGGDGSKKTKSGLAEIGKKYVGIDADQKISDKALRRKVAMHDLNSRAFGLTMQRVGEETKVGAPSPAAAMGKYYGTEHNKLRYELMLEAMGTQGVGWDGEGFSMEELAITRDWLRTKANSIEGGTSEVQLNVISKRVLGLPDK